MSQHFLQVLHPSLPGPVSYRDRARPPGCSLVWSHRHPHVAALPKTKCPEWEGKLTHPPEPGSQSCCPKEAGASHLERVVKFAGLGEGVLAVCVLSHSCNRGLGRPLPSTPLGRHWGQQRLSALPPLHSGRRSAVHRLAGPAGSLQDPAAAAGYACVQATGKAGSATRDTSNPVSPSTTPLPNVTQPHQRTTPPRRLCVIILLCTMGVFPGGGSLSEAQ